MLSLRVGAAGNGTALLDPNRPTGSKGLFSIGATGTTNASAADVTALTNVPAPSGSGSDGSITLWLPPAPVNTVAVPVTGDGTVLDVLYTLHVIQNSTSNVNRGVGPVLFPMDVTGVEYSIDGGATWRHSGGPPPAAGHAGTFSIRGLTPATAYTVLVRAVNGAGAGIQGSTTATTTRPATTTTAAPSTTSTTSPPTTAAPSIAPSTTQPPNTTTATGNPSTTTTSTSLAPTTSTTSTPATTGTSASTSTPQTPTTTTGAQGTSILPTTTAVPTEEPPGPCTRTASDGWYPDTVGSVGSTMTITPCVPAGSAPSGFAVTGGSLPTGVVLDNDAGVISGTPTESSSGAGEVTLTATLADGTTVVSTFRIGVNQMGQALGYPNRNITAVGHAMSITPTQAIASGPVRFSLVSGTLPDGLDLDASTGAISGTPTAPVDRPAPLVVRSEDATGSDEASFVVVVDDASAAVPWIRYPDNAYQVAGEKVTVRPMTSDLPEGVSFVLSGGRLPSGLSFDPTTGNVSGTASTAGATSSLLVTAVGPDRTPVASTALDLTTVDRLGQPVANDTSTQPSWWWLALLCGAILAAAGIAIVTQRHRRSAAASRT